MALPAELKIEIRAIRRLTPEDLEPSVSADPKLRRLRADIEAKSDPQTARDVLGEFVRTFLIDAATAQVEKFRESLGALLELNGKIRELYAAALEGGATADAIAQIKDLAPRRRQLLQALQRMTQVRDVEMIPSDAAAIRARLEGEPVDPDALGGTVDKQRADLPLVARPVPPDPAAAVVVAAIRAKMAEELPYKVQAVRPSSFAPEQRALLAKLDPDVAGAGYEAKFSLDVQPVDVSYTTKTGKQVSYTKQQPIDIKFDGVMKTGKRRFRALEAKFSDPTKPSIYSEARSGEVSPKEGDLREELSRQLAAIDVLAKYGCEGLTIVTNTQSSAEAIAAVIRRMGVDAARIRIEVVTL